MIAFLYPGQGSQRAGMIAALPRVPVVTDTLDEVALVLGHDVREFDTAEALTDTVAAQLALFTVGVASTRLLADNGVRPDAVVGHSIGAFPAAVAAGVLSLEAGVAAVRVRAEAMRDLYPAGFGLLAVIGARLPDVRRLVTAAERRADLFVAMENSEDQIVLAGSDAAFERVAALAAGFGVREVRRLDVAVPSHCRLMSPVADAVRKQLGSRPARRPAIRYVSALSARSAATTDAVVDDLAQGVAQMVRWRDATDLLAELGTTAVVQVSPGRATAALFAADHPEIPVLAMDDAPWADSIVRASAVASRA
ncbi:malonyl CoA-acyl carrier protein transacylase [Frondihabitans sucicola]|uniref:[acyl-carrier-protein] S-malonyltransferase n=1 Tax=Frondihabitans sucicola TaxID=1268041 RepID=A0ABN6XU76_9MICO|nr:acyltransferase domain-containing protein [Frondihabitans sucicola]BDZ48562.1 malonyl CoA-acyl carrier protein transacylase [Frondihabitans sucicola]